MNSNFESIDLITEWARVTKLVGEIQDLLREPTDPGTEPGSLSQPGLAGTLCQRAADLKAQLRSVFAKEETQGFIADLYDTAPHCTDALQQLKQERSHLLTSLDEICEQADLSARTGATYVDIKHRFDQLVADLAHHERSEDILIQRAALDQAGVID